MRVQHDSVLGGAVTVPVMVYLPLGSSSNLPVPLNSCWQSELRQVKAIVSP